MTNPALARMAKAKAAHASKFLETDASYLLEVTGMKLAINTFKGDYAIAQVKVVEATPNTPGGKVTPVGTTADYMENLSNNESNGGGRFKTFLMTLVDEKNEAKAEEPTWLDKFFDEKKQAGTHLLIRAETFTGKIKGGKRAGEDITKTKWEFVEMTDDQLAAAEQKRAAAKLPPLAEVLG